MVQKLVDEAKGQTGAVTTELPTYVSIHPEDNEFPQDFKEHQVQEIPPEAIMNEKYNNENEAGLAVDGFAAVDRTPSATSRQGFCPHQTDSPTPLIDSYLRAANIQRELPVFNAALASVIEGRSCSKCAARDAVRTMTASLSEMRALKKNTEKLSREEKRALKWEVKGIAKDMKRELKDWRRSEKGRGC